MTSDWTPWPKRTDQDHLAFAGDGRSIANPPAVALASIAPDEDPMIQRRITAARWAPHYYRFRHRTLGTFTVARIPHGERHSCPVRVPGL